MPSLHLAAGDPLSMILAADARFSQPDFPNDQIWELRLEGSEPPAIVLQTTYGLRARWMRIFPRFLCKDRTYTDPGQFHRPPELEAIYPNFLRLSCSPYNGLDIQIEYWVYSSQAVACRARLKNSTILKEILRLDWAALLSPLEEGVGMSPVSVPNSCYLAGRSGGLAPVMVMAGNSQPGSGSFPALSQEIELYPGNAHDFTWASAALENEEKSLELANSVLGSAWDSQAARIELQNSSQLIEIETGLEEWDAAFQLAQTAAYQLLLPGGQALPHPTFVLSRQPDLGYSLRGDGSDYPAIWKGQTVLDSIYLSGLILPGGVELAQGWVENFLSTQDGAGRLDWRPGLTGQKSHHLAQPLLATLAWQVSRYVFRPADWLNGIYPRLLHFLSSWFQPEMDRDNDGFPEWELPLQTGLEDLPLYNPWHPQSQGAEIQLLECPSLAAFLIRECASLAKIASLIGREEDLEWLAKREAGLRSSLADCWDQRSGAYLYRDYQSHQSQGGGALKTWQGSGRFILHRSFKVPQRLLLQLMPFEENTRDVTVRITGRSADGEVIEEISPRGWTWTQDRARATCHTLFSSLAQVEVEGAAAQDQVSLRRVDHRQVDIASFIPLWAGASTSQQAKKLVEHNLLGSYLRPYGAPICHMDRHPAEPASLDGVSPLWIQLVGEGLIQYGQVSTAVELFTRTMDGICDTLESHAMFREMVDAETGRSMGERNHLRGLPPLGFFLKLLGIEKLTESEIELRDFNPFPWPVTVKYRGLTIVCHSKEAVVTFANGQTARISGPGPHHISLE